MHNADTVLITGGSGNIGSHLTTMLLDEGYNVRHLGRKSSRGAVRGYVWDYKRGYLDPEALVGVQHIIHLAGADIAAKRWTAARRQVLLDSRVKTALLLHEQLRANEHSVRTFISAGGIAYGDRGEAWLSEEEPFGDTFDGEICRQWESAANDIAGLGLRTVILRTGLVLIREAGLLEKLTLPMKFGIAPYFGNGKQYYSWIHIEDICRLYLKAVESNSFNGSYNAVAPNPLPNKQFIRQVVKGKQARAILFPVPAFGLRLGLGALAGAILQSTRVASSKLVDAGFRFRFETVEDSVKHLYTA